MEKELEKILNINTIEIDDSKEDIHHNRYEPTPYQVLDLLIESEYIHSDDILLDIGCGKGRVSLYLNYKIGCICKGLDFNSDLIEEANKNKNNMKSNVEFICENAIDYKITNENKFYFFNPFSIEIFFSVINNIITSYYENPRDIMIFLYYPENDFMSYMMGLDEFICVDEIDCTELFNEYDERERILVFEINGF